MIRSACITAVLGGAVALVAATAVQASDDDEDPPYLIYVDPETGKYTTVDPMATRSESAAAVRPPAPQSGGRRGEGGRSGHGGPVLAAAVAAAALLLAGLGVWVRRRSDRPVMKGKATARSAR